MTPFVRAPLRALARLVTLVVLPLTLLSCAAGSLVPERESMPAARASLLPEYRIFYDSLIDYGDWVLIEPLGYVFRPRVNFVAWRPFEEGFWTPTDVYGWTWISSEPFGWATYHYGNWTYDRFQGWVWAPGADWGPAWVNWEANNDYVGWAPQPPRGGNYSYSSVPGGAFRYAPVTEMGSPALKSKIVDPSIAAAQIKNTERIDNVVEVEGVRINRGPDITWIERRTGPLARASVQDLVPPGDMNVFRQREEANRSPLGGGGRSGGLRPSGEQDGPGAPTADAMREAAERAAREARGMQERGVVTPQVSIVRPFEKSDRGSRAPGLTPRATKGRSAPDTTRKR